VFSDGSKSTKSYAKHLLEGKIGRTLLDHETADHIDEDKTNDDIDNLQVLTRIENALKSAKRKWVSLVCKTCGKEFQRKPNYERRRVKKGKDGPFCSHSCVGRLHH